MALFVVIGGILASEWLGLKDHGVKLLGTVPQGLPTFCLPAIKWADLNELLPLAFACFLLGAVETAAIGRMFTALGFGHFWTANMKPAEAHSSGAERPGFWPSFRVAEELCRHVSGCESQRDCVVVRIVLV